MLKGKVIFLEPFDFLSQCKINKYQHMWPHVGPSAIRCASPFKDPLAKQKEWCGWMDGWMPKSIVKMQWTPATLCWTAQGSIDSMTKRRSVNHSQNNVQFLMKERNSKKAIALNIKRGSSPDTGEKGLSRPFWRRHQEVPTRARECGMSNAAWNQVYQEEIISLTQPKNAWWDEKPNTREPGHGGAGLWR